MTEGALVLIVEDEQRFRRFLRASLTSHGFRSLEAGNLRPLAPSEESQRL
jgi:DNA-binding response OmpR family regulator